MEACYGGADVMERSCAMARGKDINSFKAPVIIANAGYRKGLSRKLGSGIPAAFFLHIPASR
jgi:hypothetical protein